MFAFSVPAVFPRVPVERLPGLAAVALLPWLAVLVACDDHAGWIVLDIVEFAALLATDLLLRRRPPAAGWASVSAALLLTADALVDIGTAAPGAELHAAVAMALCAELPLAAVCLALAGNAWRGGLPQRSVAPSTGRTAPRISGSGDDAGVRRYPARGAVSRTSWPVTAFSSRAIRQAQASPRGGLALAS